MAKKMSRRKFIKNMMAVIMNQPHILCITNVAKRKDGWTIKAKGLAKK